MFFVGVQLDITAPPTPKATADLQAAPACNAAVRGDPVETVTGRAGAEQQTGVLCSPAASQQVQSQVFAPYQYQHNNMLHVIALVHLHSAVWAKLQAYQIACP